MSRIVWVTDPHFNFATSVVLDHFIENIRNHRPNTLCITGDIAEAPSIQYYLCDLYEKLRIPIYFVLGNHDYYHGSITAVRREMLNTTNSDSNSLTWIPAKGVVSLTPDTALVGVDGWGDGRLGDPEGSSVFLNDWVAIEDFGFEYARSTETRVSKRIPLLNALGDEEAEMLARPLRRALSTHKTVYVLTHVPPWKEATWHMGAVSDDNYLPWFSCKAVGDCIVALSAEFPESDVKVLCGHCHSAGTVQISDNVTCITGAAEYGRPQINGVYDL